MKRVREAHESVTLLKWAVEERTQGTGSKSVYLGLKSRIIGSRGESSRDKTKYSSSGGKSLHRR